MKSRFLFTCLISGIFFAGAAFATDSVNIYTYKVGVYNVSLLVESTSNGKSSLLLNTDADMLVKYIPDGTFPMELNAYLIQTPDNNILVDTGFGINLATNLQALGVNPEDVDTVLLTHMHGDHISGLLKDGKPVFPNATIYLAAQEKAYWTDKDIMSEKPENQQGGFKLAQQSLEAYGKNVRTFTPGVLGTNIADILPGIEPVAAFGHTPGHTMYMVNSEGEHLLIWGDLVHSMAIQFAVPDVSLVYDVDPKAAAVIRKEVFSHVSKFNIPVAGIHLLYPGFGHVNTQDGGRYNFVFME